MDSDILCNRRVEIHNIKKKKPFNNDSDDLAASELTEDNLTELASDKSLFCIQISNYIPENVIEMLDKYVFSVRGDVQFRIYGFYGQEADLSFLRIFSNLKSLVIDVDNAKNADAICELKNLIELRLYIGKFKDYSFIANINPGIRLLALSVDEITSRSGMDCKWLLGFNKLRQLYLGKVKKNLAFISGLKSLECLMLRGITCNSLEFVMDMHIKKLSILWGSMKCFDDLCGHKTLNYVQLWRISKFDNNMLNFLTTLPELKKLHLMQLACITGLPEFKPDSRIECIDIDECKKFTDIHVVEHLKNLKKIRIVGNVPEEDIKYVLNNKGIEEILYYCGGSRQSERVGKLIKEAGKGCIGAWEFDDPYL